MKKIKIQFSGFEDHFKCDDNFIYNVLKKKFEIEISNSPDYIFYTVKSKDFLKYNCIRIFYTIENIVPDFNLCDYGIGFNYLEFGDRYIRYPFYLSNGISLYNNRDNLELVRNKHKNSKDILKEKTAFCSFIYSNKAGADCRKEMFLKLSEYKNVNSGGSYCNNIGHNVVDKLEFQTKHKFVIAFENTSTSGYTTEKIMDAYAAQAIPIYWGNPDICKEFNSKSFINCHEYNLTAYGDNESPLSQILSRVNEIDDNDEMYIDIMNERAFNKEFDIDLLDEKLEMFLYHIFEQEKEDAFRRNRYFWGQKYERRIRIGDLFYQKFRKLLPLRDSLLRIKNGIGKKGGHIQ